MKDTPSTLFVSDMDGTLLDAQATLSPLSMELLNRAIAAGTMFTVATARTPATVDVIMRGVDMRLPAIVMTGAAWWHFDSQSYSHVKYMGADNAAAVLAAFDRHGVVPFVYTLDTRKRPEKLSVYFSESTPSATDSSFIEQRRHLPLKTFYIGETVSYDRLPYTVLFFASGMRDALRSVAEDISRATDCSVSVYDDIYNPGVGLIEVFGAGVSKANALTELKRELGCDRLVVFGDNLNDLSMFAVADVSVAVGNALADVRKAADIVIGDNTSDAVPRYLLT